MRSLFLAACAAVRSAWRKAFPAEGPERPKFRATWGLCYDVPPANLGEKPAFDHSKSDTREFYENLWDELETLVSELEAGRAERKRAAKAKKNRSKK